MARLIGTMRKRTTTNTRIPDKKNDNTTNVNNKQLCITYFTIPSSQKLNLLPIQGVPLLVFGVKIFCTANT